MQESKQQTGFRATLKSSDTEETIDIYFYRPLGYAWALLFRKLGVSPNVVTVLSIFLGIGAGISFYFPTMGATLLGILLLVWANSYDSADGQLARMTQNFSPLGRILDGFAGNLWFITIYFAICFRLFPQWGYWIWALAIVTGYCHSKQAAMADYYRNIHLFFLKGKAKSELDNSQELARQYAEKKWSDGFLDKLFSHFYLGYTKGQEALTPNFQRMISLVDKHFGGVASEQFRADFRMQSLPLMKWTNVLSFNTRAIALFVAMLADVPYAYFIFEITILNALLVYMVWKHERICKQFATNIEAGKYN